MVLPTKQLRRAFLCGVVGGVFACGNTEPPKTVTSPSPTDPAPAPTPAPGSATSPASPASPDGAEPSPEPTATNVTVETLVVSGLSRTFALAVPRSYAPASHAPLVLAFHGDGGDGPSLQRYDPFDAETKSDAIVAYPSGRNGGWDLYTPDEENVDVAFVVALVDEVHRRFDIDPARVFGVGFSSGAFLLNQLACRRPGLLRGFAANAGGAPAEPMTSGTTHYENGMLKCPGSPQPLGVLVIHGTEDHEVPPESGDYDAAYWAFVNGCAETRSATTPAPCVASYGCPASSPVVYCSIPGLGHGIWEHARKTSWAFLRGL